MGLSTVEWWRCLFVNDVYSWVCRLSNGGNVYFVVRDGIISVADYNLTLMGVVVVVVVVVVVYLFRNGIT